LNFCISILYKIENENRSDSFVNTFYRTGIESTNFLFDIINALTGYHELYHYKNNSSYNYVHCLLSLTNFDSILNFND
jgi:hypothetical protein